MLESWLKNKLVKKEMGVPIMYIVYQPQKELPNVITHHIHPDIGEEKELNILLKEVAERVRDFYENNPKLLDEVLKSVSK